MPVALTSSGPVTKQAPTMVSKAPITRPRRAAGATSATKASAVTQRRPPKQPSTAAARNHASSRAVTAMVATARSGALPDSA